MTEVDATPPTALDTIRSLIPSVYVPVLVSQTGVAMLSLILPLYGESIELSNTAIGLMMAGAGIGGVLSQVRIGTLVAQRTAREVILWSLLLMAVTTVPMPFTENQWLLVGLRILWGCGSVGLLIGMQTRLTRATTAADRGRAMSTWGVILRLAILIGPVVAGFVVDELDYVVAFALAASAFAFGAVPVQRAAPIRPRTAAERSGQVSTLTAVRPHLTLLLTAGIAHLCIISGRFGRMLILPLIGLDLGLSEAEIGGLVGLSAAADLLLSPLSGILMDRFGRLFAIVPAFGGFSLGLVLLGFASSGAEVAAAAVMIGAFNGIGSGTMLTLSSDLAPPDATSQFLAAVGTIRDGGRIAGPFIVGALADVAGLDVSAWALGGITALGLAIIVFGLGDTGRHEHAGPVVAEPVSGSGPPPTSA